METGEIVFVVLLVVGFLGPTAFFGQWWLFSVFMIFFMIFGLVEYVSVKKTDLSVSQHFWEFSKKNKIKACLILGGMLVGWLALLFHLGGRFLF
jgi:hypothetical protein